MIFADPAGVAVGGPYTGTVQIAPAGGNPAIVVNVSMTVSTIGASPSQLTFGYQANGSLPNPANLTLTAAANTTYTAYRANDHTRQLARCAVQRHSAGNAAVTLNAAVVQFGSRNVQRLGDYYAVERRRQHDSGHPDRERRSDRNGSPTSTLNLNYQIGGATGSTNTPTATLTLSNPGIQDLAFGISPTPNGSWLSVNPASGFIPANGSIPLPSAISRAQSAGGHVYRIARRSSFPSAANHSD